MRFFREGFPFEVYRERFDPAIQDMRVVLTKRQYDGLRPELSSNSGHPFPRDFSSGSYEVAFFLLWSGPNRREWAEPF